MPRVAVIGARGFIGRHLVALMAAQGRQVAGVSLNAAPAEMLCSDWLACDVTKDEDGLVRFLDEFSPQAVIHLAASTFEPLAAAQPWNVLRNNQLTTLNVLTACRRLKQQPISVIVSSSAVYGQPGEGEPSLAETHPLNPLTTYGVSKVAAEALTLQHNRAFGSRGIIVRPFNVTGPGEHASFVTSAFARQIALIEAGRQPGIMKVGELRTARDFIDVRDVAAALVKVAELGIPGEAYNVCSGVAVTIGDLVHKLLQAAVSEVEVNEDPALKRSVEVETQSGDSRKLRQATGWEPRYSLVQTLSDVLADWRLRIQSLGI